MRSQHPGSVDPLAPPSPGDALARALGGSADGLEGLSVASRVALARLVDDTRERQRREVQQAIDAALTHVPAVLRGAIRRLLFS